LGFFKNAGNTATPPKTIYNNLHYHNIQNNLERRRDYVEENFLTRF